MAQHGTIINDKAFDIMINDGKKSQTMGKEGRKLAEKEYSVDKVIDVHLKIYKGFTE